MVEAHLHVYAGIHHTETFVQGTFCRRLWWRCRGDVVVAVSWWCGSGGRVAVVMVWWWCGVVVLWCDGSSGSCGGSGGGSDVFTLRD